MKTLFLKIFFIGLGGVLSAVLIGLALLFFRPQLLINKKNLAFALDKSGIFSEWSWQQGSLEHEFIQWNERRFSGNFKYFCFKYDSDKLGVSSCLENISWDFKFMFSSSKGFELMSMSPILVTSDGVNVKLKAKPEDARIRQAQESAPPPNVKRYWTLFWSKFVPDASIDMKNIAIENSEGKKLGFDVEAKKSGREFLAKSLGFTLRADPASFTLLAPSPFKIPMNPGLMGPMALENAKASGRFHKNELDINLSGSIIGILFQVNSFVSLPLKDPPASVAFLKQFALNTKVHAKVDQLARKTSKALSKPYNELPAPLNTLDGPLELTAWARPGIEAGEIEVVVKLMAHMQGEKQELEFDLINKVLFDLESKELGAIFLGLDVKKVMLQMPRLPKSSLPPQFFPDGRIHNEKLSFEKELAKQNKNEVPPDVNLRLKALGENFVGFRTNLLEEPLRFYLDLAIERGKLKGGYVKTLPLDTTFFNTKISVKKFLISFDNPENPEVDGEILFDLPEYQVTLFLEGPLSQPRHYMTSDPPLPKEDIYSVLLFGRPMIDLSGGDKNAVQRTNQVLSQGLLSIGVLYFLSDTPIQAIIYDPDSDQVSAQIGIGEKSSLTVGQDSVGVRRSLGRGWYVDTSTEKNTGYGVMLERILAY